VGYNHGRNNHEGKIGGSVGMGIRVPESASYCGAFAQNRLNVALNNA